MNAKRVDTWAASIKDKPGGLAGKLTVLAEAGVNLEFVIARRTPERRGSAVVFATPIAGAAQCRAARKVGFERTKSLHTVRIEGPDKAGQGAAICQALAHDKKKRGAGLRWVLPRTVGQVDIAEHVPADVVRTVLQSMNARRTP